MRALTDLGNALVRVNAQALARVRDVAPSPMAQVAEETARLLSPARAAAAAPSFGERELEAVRCFRDRTGEPNFRTLRLACSACAHAIAEDGYVLLADPGGLDALLGAVDRYTDEPRWFRRLFDLLRKAYLNADREVDWFTRTDVSQGNERLRQFLEDRFARVVQIEPVLDWVRTLTEHPEILSSTPGQHFAQDLLDGDWQDLEAVCRSLGVTGSSWLVSETVRSATAVAVDQADHEAFKSHILALLGLAGEQRFAVLRDEVYAALVTRYADIPTRPVHPELRDALIVAWKNPWLVRNDSAWGRVSPEARKMVAGWLKLDIIRQFFDVLSEDRGQDRSRFKFWSGYHEQMSDVYIALGQNAYFSSSPDLVKLRRALEGRLLQLSGPADTHAFIMFMGDVVVVEFSQKGNAAYLYLRTDAPVHDDVRTATIWQLKSKSTGDRMLHIGAQGRTWQQRFEEALGDLGVEHRTGAATVMRSIEPSGAYQPHSVSRSLNRRRDVVRRRDVATFTAPRPPAASIDDVVAFARRHTLNWADHRSRGGVLWVLAKHDDSEIARQLKAWGFAYRQGKGWWRNR